MGKEGAKKTGSGGNRHTYRPQTKPTFKSDVVGLEKWIFEYGLAKHAAQYVKTKKALANYIQKEYTKGGPDIAEAIRTGKPPITTIPTKPVGGDEFDKRMWFYHYKRTSNKQAILEAAGNCAYALVKGQCSPALVEHRAMMMLNLPKTYVNYSSSSEGSAVNLMSILKAPMP